MKYSRITLKFRGPDRHLEERFLKEYFRNSLIIVRVAVLIGLAFYAAFGVLDALLLPELKNEIWKIRYGVGCPVLLLTFLLSFSRHFKRIWQPILSTALVTAGLGIIAMTILAPPPVNSSYYAGLILVLVFNYAVIRALFLWANFTGWALVVAYWVSATQLTQTPVPSLINNLFFFIGANLLGMISCYLSELSGRKNFFLLHLLDAEKEKVLASNRSLEEKVRELETAEAEIQTLSGFLPICSNCKKIRDDKGYWSRIEIYISSHSHAKFSHGICPDCAEELYPEFASEPDAPPPDPLQYTLLYSVGAGRLQTPGNEWQLASPLRNRFEGKGIIGAGVLKGGGHNAPDNQPEKRMTLSVERSESFGLDVKEGRGLGRGNGGGGLALVAKLRALIPG